MYPTRTNGYENGFVAQIGLKSCFPLPQRDSAYGHSTRYAQCCEAAQDRGANGQIKDAVSISERPASVEDRAVHVPLPIRICAHLADPFLADLSGKQRAKSVPQKSNRLIADVDAALVQQVLDVSDRK